MFLRRILAPSASCSFSRILTPPPPSSVLHAPSSSSTDPPPFLTDAATSVCPSAPRPAAPPSPPVGVTLSDYLRGQVAGAEHLPPSHCPPSQLAPSPLPLNSHLPIRRILAPSGICSSCRILTPYAAFSPLYAIPSPRAPPIRLHPSPAQPHRLRPSSPRLAPPPSPLLPRRAGVTLFGYLRGQVAGAKHPPPSLCRIAAEFSPRCNRLLHQLRLPMGADTAMFSTGASGLANWYNSFTK
ncbi:vegetative cell wall protein gp1-like isoform X3 [Phragmites australis]|uniref:vegetative cell wall protein gp1-like isoform X3 n=1 Tax=Phragmites australis TaxID=29695 RepID=UPI002D7931FB|nr:vegetative cell wall protein gp1-like isoform X3 [Phragmites australis]